ncbi:hypothetical protein Tco_1517015 [Tanacetum coccineum]
MIHSWLASRPQETGSVTKTLRLLKGLRTTDGRLADCIGSFVCLATKYRSFVQAMIDEGVTAALAARDATRNGNDSHTSRTGA